MQPVSARRVIGASVFWWMVALGFLGWVVAIMPSKNIPEFWVTVRDHDMAGAGLGILFLVLAQLLKPLFARCDWARIALFIERNLIVLCALCFALYAGLAFWAHQHQTFSLDEYCLLTESRNFAAGQSSGWVPPALLKWMLAPEHIGEFFAVSSDTGDFTPVYWPGVALLATPFTFLGVSWLCNPFLGALALWGVHRLTYRVSGSREAAAWAWALTVASPVIALNASTLYAMPAHLLFNVFYCLLLLRDDRRGALGAGLVGGFALVLHNPVPHMAFALPWLFYIARKRRHLLLPLVLGYLVFSLPLGFGWSRFIGASFDADKYAPFANVVGASSPFAEMLGRFMAIVSFPTPYIVLARMGGMAKTVLWAVPGLLVLAWLGWRMLACQKGILAPASQLDVEQVDQGDESQTVAGKIDSRALRLLAASFLVTFLVYFMVPFDQTLGWGFRYIHSAWFVLAILGACFLAGTPKKSVLRPFFVALCVLTLALSLPLRAFQANRLVTKHRQQIPTTVASASITFINIDHGSFTFDLLHNDPFLRNDDWRFVSHGATPNARLAREYLSDPKRTQSGNWGEIWVGSALRHPKFPPPHR